MIEISIDLTDAAYLENISLKLKNPAPLMAGIAEVMKDAVEENFEQQGRPKWHPLKKSTIMQRRKNGRWPRKILQQEGNLAVSVTSDYGNDYAVVGTDKKYAAIHQFGGRAGRGKRANIPARPFLSLSPADEEEIINTTRDFLH